MVRDVISFRQSFRKKQWIVSVNCNLVKVREDTPHMPVLHRTTQRAEVLLRQMLDLLEELSLHYGQEHEDATAPNPARDRELLLSIAEEAAERGLDEEQIEKLFRSVIHVAREAGTV